MNINHDHQIGLDEHGNYYERRFDAWDGWSVPKLVHLTPQLPPQHWVYPAAVWDED